ncbi:hypothetical protein LINPERHAP1_LOCUS41394, partial [Linum perenne]
MCSKLQEELQLWRSRHTFVEDEINRRGIVEGEDDAVQRKAKVATMSIPTTGMEANDEEDDNQTYEGDEGDDEEVKDEEEDEEDEAEDEAEEEAEDEAEDEADEEEEEDAEEEADAEDRYEVGVDDITPVSTKSKLFETEVQALEFSQSLNKKGSAPSYTPVAYDRPRTVKMHMTDVYVILTKHKIGLTAEERLVVTYALSTVDGRGAILVCKFPEHRNHMYKFQLASMDVGQRFASSVINSCSHLINREQKEMTRVCFPIGIANSAREEIEVGAPYKPDSSLVSAGFRRFMDKSLVPYVQRLVWKDLQYAFFPTHAGEDFEHFYVLLVDFVKKEKTILNSLSCREDFESKRWYKPSGTRLMQYARTFFLDTVGVDIKSFMWKVVAAPVQPDINSCGLYTVRFMELYIGRFTAEHKHQFDDTTFLDTDRLRYMSRLLLSEANEL